MALGKYEDIYTTEQLQARVTDIENALLSNSNMAISFVISKETELKRQLKELQNKEKEMFKLFGNDINNIDDLNKQLEKYRENVLTLSGPQLYKEYLYQIRNKNEASATLFNEAVQELIQDIINENNPIGEKIKGAWDEVVHEWVMSELNTQLSKSQNKHFSFSSKAGWRGISSLGELQAHLFTPEQQEGFRKLMQLRIANKTQDSAMVRYLNERQAIRSNGKSVTFVWTKVTGETKPTEAKKTFGEKGITEINEIIKQRIIDDVKGAENKELIRIIIDYVLKKENVAFFVGQNENAITGILGEIQALYYICSLTGLKPNDADVKWQGGLPEDGKQPHRDIVLKNFGIQVKNTTKDILSGKNGMEVGFWELKLDTFLDRLGLNDEVRTLFENFYGTCVFNIPYIYDPSQEKGSKYIKTREGGTSYPTYNVNREYLLSMQKQIDILMSVYTAAIMYMDTTNQIKEVDTDDLNSLYILGGVTAVTASQILKKVLNILKQLRENPTMIGVQTDLSVKANSDMNIVTALNRGERNPNYSTDIMDSIVLKSSYTFLSV